MIKLKLSQILEENDITRYRLAKEANLSNQTLYALADRIEPKAVQLEPLDKILTALRNLTHKDLTLCDLLEYTPNA